MIRKTTSGDIERCYQNVVAGLMYHNIKVPPVVAKMSSKVLFQAALETVGDIYDAEKTGEFRSWAFNRNHGVTAVQGWRENVPWYSMQIVLHDTGVLECDYDICNPDYGLALAVGHFVEVVWPGKTNPWRVFKGLQRRGVL